MVVVFPVPPRPCNAIIRIRLSSRKIKVRIPKQPHKKTQAPVVAELINITSVIAMSILTEFTFLSNSWDENKPCGDIYPYHPEVMDFLDMLIEDVIPFCDTDFLSVHGDEVGTLKTGKTKDAVLEKGEIAEGRRNPKLLSGTMQKMQRTVTFCGALSAI